MHKKCELEFVDIYREGNHAANNLASILGAYNFLVCNLLLAY
ncbi:hypothetical protein LINPERPRIM_LOCUS12148 [Linum perenne]